MKTTIPEAEDLPLVLAMIKKCHDPFQKCKRPHCGRQAVFAVDEYEDKQVIEDAIRKGLSIHTYKELEELIWQHTKQEQMLNHFTVHGVYYSCFAHELQLLMAFLNTPLDRDLRLLLTTLPDAGAIVQFHYLSRPDDGCVSPTLCTTAEAWMDWMRNGYRIVQKVQE